MNKNILILVHAAAYGSERALSALRIAATLSAREEKPQLTLFLMSDGVGIAQAGQETGEKQTLEAFLNDIVGNGARVLLCKTCVNARGLQNARWAKGCEIGTLNDLAELTLLADSTLCF